METLLFACGTLMLEKVHVALFGRVLPYDEDALPGHATRTIVIENPDILSTTGAATHLAMMPSDAPGASVPGRAMQLSDTELAIIDPYQHPHYHRTRVTLASGREAWAYIAA